MQIKNFKELNFSQQELIKNENSYILVLLQFPQDYLSFSYMNFHNKNALI